MGITVMNTFPKDLVLGRSNTHVTVRPLEQGDAHELLEFFTRVPEDDRFYLKENVTSPDVIGEWVNHIDYERVLPLVALVDGEIVADATLHRTRSMARRHVGEIRVVVDPRFRGQGLGTLITREVIDTAYLYNLDSVVFELVEDKEANAIKVAEKLGFTRIATLPSFVKDMEGQEHSLVVMLLPLDDWLDWWAF